MSVTLRRRRMLVGLVSVALAAALLSVLSPWAIPLGTVPVTFGLLGVYLIGAVLGPARATLAVGVYLALGVVGVPVFGGFSGGAGHFLSPTGGFLVGYLLCAFVVSLSAKSRKIWLLAVLLPLGTLACYTVGVIWYCVVTETAPSAALLVCVLPMLPFDIGKMIAACLLVRPLGRVYDKMKEK